MKVKKAAFLKMVKDQKSMTELKKSLGLISLLFYGIGMILGAGIYSVLGAATAKSQNAIWMSFVLASFIALLTGLSYAELATKLPHAGAEYSYVRSAFPKRGIYSFTTGIVVCILGAATTATVSLAFANYLQSFIELPLASLAFGMIALVTVVNIAGLQVSSKLNILFTLIEVSGLVIVIVLGMQSETFASNLSLIPNAGVLPATALLFFSYLGFENIVALSEEAKNPSRDIPLAIIISVIITTIIYILVGLAAIALVDPKILLGDEAPLIKIVGASAPRLIPIIQAIALFATSNTALISILTASRIAFAMARNGDLPDYVTRIASQRGSPWIATLAISIAAILMLPLGKVEVIAELTSFLALIVFAGVHIVLITLRFKSEVLSSTFVVPLKIGKMPLLPCLGLLTILFMMTQFSGKVYMMSIGVIMGSVLLYGILRFAGFLKK